MENTLCSVEYDENLSQIQHYRNHPQMLPFIGKNWGRNVERVLLIGESSFAGNSWDCSKNWYEITKKELNDKQRKDTSPREIIEDGYLKNSFGNNRIFSEINSIIKEISNGEKDILYFSFVNFFQRPAIKKNEKFNKLDISIGNKVIKEVVEILHPEYIFILSYIAWDRFNIDYDSKILIELFKKNKIEYSCHPTDYWWNRKSREYSGTAKEKFKNFMKNITNKIGER
jgi:hypothetical protein